MAMIVPKYEQNQVVQVQAPVPVAARQSGAGALAPGLADAGAMLDRWQADVDEARAKEADAAFANDLRTTLYDPENGYLNARGGDAVNRRAAVMQDLDRVYTERLNSLSPAAREMAEQSLQARLDRAKLGIDTHAGDERISYLDGTSDARMQAAVNDAVTDPAMLSQSLQILRGEIVDKAERQGWSSEQTALALSGSESELYRMMTINIAQGDAVAAAEFLAQKAGTMQPADLMAAREALTRPLAAAAEQDAIRNAQAGIGPGRVGPTTFAATDLPREAYALLGTIAGTEAPDYQTINGGEKFADFSDHPRRKGGGGKSTAAGRYQYVQATWDRVAAANGFTDFSPANQDRGAWWLAQQDYKSNTGRDLMADLQAGNYAEVRKGLGSTWEGIHKLSDAEFAKRMQNASGLTISPQVAQAVDSLPAYQASQVREAAYRGTSAWETQQNAERAAEQRQMQGEFELRIAQLDTTLTEGEILATNLDDGTKATLITSRRSKFEEFAQTSADMAAFAAGRLMVDPYSSDGRKRVDLMWTEQAKVIQEGQDPSAIVADIVAQTGLVPTPVVNALRSGMTSRDIAQVQSALVTASRLAEIDQHAFSRIDGGSKVAEMAALYDQLTGSVGMTGEEAARRIMDLSDPEKQRDRKALLSSPETEVWLKDTATEDGARAIFDPGFFSRTPRLGETPLQTAAAVAEFREILEQSLVDANGDQEMAETMAQDRFRRRYGVSSYSLSSGGRGVVTRLPPEVTYPAGVDGTHDYLGQQAIAALAAEEVEADQVFFQSDNTTAADVRAGRPPRYLLYYKDAEGMLQQFQYRFTAEPPAPGEVDAARRQRAIEEQEAYRAAQEALRAPENQRGNNALR